MMKVNQGQTWTRGRIARLATAVLAALATSATLACGGAQATTPVGPAGDQEVAPGVPMIVQASATAGSKDKAYRAALARLDVEIYGSAEWAEFLALSAHDPARDPIQKRTSKGQVEVVLGMTRERLAQFFDELARTPWEREAPGPLAPLLAKSYPLYLQHLVCERRRALLDEECELPDIEAVRAELKTLAGAITLKSTYAGGVPLDSAGKPLRPVGVKAELATPVGVPLPLAGLPMVASTPEQGILQSTEGETDAVGVVTFAIEPGKPWPEQVRVALDTAAMLGPLAADWPAAELFVKGRKTSAHRWAMISKERVQGRTVTDGLVAGALDQALRERGAGPMVALSADTVATLSSASAATINETLPALADAWAGRIDVLMVVELDSEFASRMGAHRVWYEARGRADVYDVWTGKRLASVPITGTAAGVGDARADRAARKQFALDLAGKLEKEPLLTFAR